MQNVKTLNRRLPKWTTPVVFTEKRKKRPITMPLVIAIFSRAGNIDSNEMLVWNFQTCSSRCVTRGSSGRGASVGISRRRRVRGVYAGGTRIPAQRRVMRAHYAECTRRSVGESGVAGLRGSDRSSGSVCSGHSSQRQSGADAAGGLGVSGSQPVPAHR